jgi:predicted DNA-binding ribbon-helix-helix protein
MKSSVIKRSIVIGGHKTSVSLEDAFWQELKEIAKYRCVTVSQTVAEIDTRRENGNLSSAIRLFVLDHARAQASPARTPTSWDFAAGRKASRFGMHNHG